MSVVNGKYLLDALLMWEAGVQMPAPPSILYVALLTAMPTKNDATGLVEATGTGYARMACPAADWAAITTAVDNLTEQSSTNADLSVTPSVSLGSIVGVALYDAATNGNFLRAMTLQSGPVTVGANETFTLSAGSLTRQAA